MNEVKQSLSLRLESGVPMFVRMVEHAQPPVRSLQLFLRRLIDKQKDLIPLRTNQEMKRSCAILANRIPKLPSGHT